MGYTYLTQLKLKPKDLFSFFANTQDKLDRQGSTTNFLLLGIRGEGSDSPNLSDSIIFFSYNHEAKQVTQISIPRDLWVPSIRDKINTAYHYGEEASPGSGIKLADASVIEVLGQPVNYTAIVDFSLFKSVIDLVGGVDVYVSPGFVDNNFPIPGKENIYPITERYETISFPEGTNHLDGETALKFVRSRHSQDDQGTDFARSKRQQSLLSALKQKIINSDFLLDQNKVTELIDIIQKNLITNLPPNLYSDLAHLILDTTQNPFKTVILDTVPTDGQVAILYNPPITKKYDNKWVLLPKDDNWKALKQFISSSLATPQ